MSRPSLAGNEEKYVVDAVRSSWISSIGPYVTRFEKDFSSYIGINHGVAVANGTVAITLALRALEIGPGDEVIVPSFTFAGTVNAILHVGAIPVLVDSLPEHWNIDPSEIQKAISPATKAIMPVHLYGHPCDMEPILQLAKQRNLYVIEDAAEAHGAETLGKKVGSLGHISCFSFFGNKIVTTGEGGMCLTQDASLDERMRMLRDHGMDRSRRYWHVEVGYNCRTTNLNAAIGVAQLENIQKFLDRRAHLARIYAEGIANIPGLRIYADCPFGKPVDWFTCVFVEPEFPLTRDQLIQALKDHQIDSRPTFYPVHLMPPYRQIRKLGNLENTERFGLSGLNLPLYPDLRDEDARYIVEVLARLAGRQKVQPAPKRKPQGDNQWIS